jgi:hypothetical protein
MAFSTVVLAGLFTACFSFIYWDGFQAQALAFYALLLGVIEFMVHFRWRLNVVCQHCGFDPVLYIRKPSAAADKVIAHMEKVANSPVGVLNKLDLPARPLAPVSKKPQITGKNLSKQV